MSEDQPVPKKVPELAPPKNRKILELAPVPKPIIKDKTGINWNQYRELVEVSDPLKILKLRTLEGSGLVVPVFVNSLTQEAQPVTLGWFKEDEELDLSNGWRLCNYFASYDSENTLSATCMLERQKTVGRTTHDVLYSVGPVDHLLFFRYEAEDEESEFCIFVGTEKQSNVRVLKTTVYSTNKDTQYQFKFEFDSSGTMTEITFRRRPLKGVIIEVGSTQEAQSAGEEVGVWLQEKSVDLGDMEKVNELCRTHLGITPKANTRLKLNTLTTLKWCLENINKDESEMQAHPVRLIDFDRSTVGQDIRALG